jgi:hypothetical protein
MVRLAGLRGFLLSATVRTPRAAVSRPYRRRFPRRTDREGVRQPVPAFDAHGRNSTAQRFSPGFTTGPVG